jgi:prepilin-type N-terminal cleavage/methylation domain-containing protein
VLSLNKKEERGEVMERGFTYLELLVVIVIVGILASIVNVAIFSPSLSGLRDQVLSHLMLTASTASQDDKIYYQLPSTVGDLAESNRSAYYFKQFWQFKIMENSNKEISYCIFSDQPRATTTTNFDERAHNQYPTEVLTNGRGQYLCHDTDDPDYESKEDPFVNLTKKYKIEKVIFNYTDLDGNLQTKVVDLNDNSYTTIRLLFDNLGNLFLDEGKSGDGKDYNIFDPAVRPLLISEGNLTFCQESPTHNCEKNVTLTIYPTGIVVPHY